MNQPHKLQKKNLKINKFPYPLGSSIDFKKFSFLNQHKLELDLTIGKQKIEETIFRQTERFTLETQPDYNFEKLKNYKIQDYTPQLQKINENVDLGHSYQFQSTSRDVDPPSLIPAFRNPVPVVLRQRRTAFSHRGKTRIRVFFFPKKKKYLISHTM